MPKVSGMGHTLPGTYKIPIINMTILINRELLKQSD